MRRLREVAEAARQAVRVSATGGARGGGAVVTELGQEVLARYRRMQKKAAASIAADLGHLLALMASPTEE